METRLLLAEDGSRNGRHDHHLMQLQRRVSETRRNRGGKGMGVSNQENLWVLKNETIIKHVSK